MSLYHFVWGERKQPGLQLENRPGSHDSSSRELAVISALQKVDIAHESAQNFADNLVKVIGSDDFLRELSREIREPGLTESEDAFVARSKATMMKLLDKHLG